MGSGTTRQSCQPVSCSVAAKLDPLVALACPEPHPRSCPCPCLQIFRALVCDVSVNTLTLEVGWAGSADLHQRGCFVSSGSPGLEPFTTLALCWRTTRLPLIPGFPPHPLQVTGKEDKMVALKEVLEPYGERTCPWPAAAGSLLGLGPAWLVSGCTGPTAFCSCALLKSSCDVDNCAGTVLNPAPPGHQSLKAWSSQTVLALPLQASWRWRVPAACACSATRASTPSTWAAWPAPASCSEVARPALCSEAAGPASCSEARPASCFRGG